MNKSDLLAGVSRAMMAEVMQDVVSVPQTQYNIHAEDVPPHIRNTAYEMAGAFFGQNQRSPEFRAMAGRMSAETFAIVSWPQFVNIAIECLTECLTWPSIPMHEKDLIADEMIAFNAAKDARAASTVRTKKILEPLN